MIKDKLLNSSVYYSLSERIKTGLSWLESTDLINIADGKYLIDGENVYASVQTYVTKDDAKYESHRRYIDIQYMIDGEEKIGVTDLSNCVSCVEYDSEKDLEFYDISSEEEYLALEKGQFLILYPHDAHKPSISKKEKLTVKKVVVKVAI